MNYKMLLFIVLCIWNNANAVVIAKGDSTAANTTFTTAVVSSVFDRPSQTMFVGLTNGAGNYAISKARHNTPDNVPNFTAIGSNAGITTKYVDNLTLSHSSSDPKNPYLVFTAEDDSSDAPTTFKVIDSTGNSYATSAALEDSSSATTGKILKLAATPSYVIAVVKTTAVTSSLINDYPSDGLAITGITRGTTPTFTYYNASDGTTTTPTALNIANTDFRITATTITMSTFRDMIYTPHMGGRVYLSAVATTAANTGDRTFGFVVCSVGTGILTKLTRTTADSTVIASDDTTTKIVAVASASNGADFVDLRKLAIMETSTGFYYLIVNGGAAAAGGDVRNEVYALPLVSGSATDAENGTLAKNDLTTDDFSVRASGADDTPTKSGSPLTAPKEALVGNGLLPIAANDTNVYVSDMQAVGDCVYCAIRSNSVNTTNAPGVYYSQAVFNDKGKIARWTDWAKAAPFILGNSETDGSLKHIAVDATTGDLWGVTTGATVVKKTEWTTTGVDSDSLVSKLNDNLSDGCFSVFDLNQSIQNFGDTATNRYAYFGGRGKVIFTKVSTAGTAAYLGVQNTVKTDFSAATELATTTISGDAAPVCALGYSKSSTAAQGYFFAGTMNGCYAWCKTAGGAGFSPAAGVPGDLNADPFDGTYSWQKITNITGAVVAIKSTANATYVLTRDNATDTTIADKLFSFKIGANLSTLNTNVKTIATSGTSATGSDLTSAKLFFDFEVLIGAADGTDDKILLATSDGIYQSAVAVEDDTNQQTATWVQVSNPATNDIVYDLITAPKNSRLVSMAWSSEWADNGVGNNTYDLSSLRQLTSNDTTTLVDMPNAHFNSDSATVITTLLPIKYLWSDGARRFMVAIPENSNGLTNAIKISPFRIGSDDWHITAEPGPAQDKALKTQDRFYWVENIGATGHIMAGGNKGVVSLE